MENTKTDLAIKKANKFVSAPQKAILEVVKTKNKKLLVYDKDTTKNAGRELTRTHSALDEKLMNACIHKMQVENSKITYDDIKLKATKIVDSFNIDISKHKNVYDCALEEECRKILREEIKKIYVFKTEDILNLCGIQADNLKYALNKLKEFQSKNVSLITEYIPNSTFTGIEEQTSSINPIPRITVRPNKIEVELQSYAVPYLFALAHGFTKINILQIQNLKSTYSMRLYDICTMLYKIQNTKLYDFEELQALFGTNYKNLTEFKRNVLNKAILEVAQKTDIEVQLKKVNSKIKFKITRKTDFLTNSNIEDISLERLAHFLTCEQFFKNLGRVTAVQDFTKYKRGVLKKLETRDPQELEIDLNIARLNFSALEEIKRILTTSQTKYLVDEQFLIVRSEEKAFNDYGFVRVGDNPVECYEYLTKKKFLGDTPPQSITLDLEIARKNESDEFVEPSEIFKKIVDIAAIQYTDSSGEKIRIDNNNIDIMVDEMINRCSNSADQYRFFYLPKAEQKILFSKLTEQLKSLVNI